MDNDDDKNKIVKIRNDIFNSSLNIMEIDYRYKIQTIDGIFNVKTTKTLSYVKKRAYDIDQLVHENVID